jgi:hypothetical protein
MWAEVSSLTPHLLRNGLSSSPSRLKMPPRGVVTSKQASHHPGLSRVKGQQKDILWEDFQRPVTTEDLPRMTYLE